MGTSRLKKHALVVVILPHAYAKLGKIFLFSPLVSTYVYKYVCLSMYVYECECL